MARKRKAPIRSSTEAASKKLATKDSDVEQDPSPCKADNIESCIFEAESDNDEERRLIESTMIELLIQRGPEKTCWPSEIPRRIHKNWKSLTTERKKELMVTTRAVAYRLASTSAPIKSKVQEAQKDSIVPDEVISEHTIEYPFLEVSQKKIGISNPSEETVKGPIRLRLLRLPAEDSIGKKK